MIVQLRPIYKVKVQSELYTVQYFSCVAGAGSSTMVVPTLPVIGVTPPIIVFTTLEWLAFSFVYALLVAAIVSFGVMWTSHCRRIPMQCGPRSYCRLKTLFLFVGRMLCVHTFPALFKMHKTRSGHGSQMRSFMVFLDRKVERSLTLIAVWLSYKNLILIVTP